MGEPRCAICEAETFVGDAYPAVLSALAAVEATAFRTVWGAMCINHRRECEAVAELLDEREDECELCASLASSMSPGEAVSFALARCHLSTYRSVQAKLCGRHTEAVYLLARNWWKYSSWRNS